MVLLPARCDTAGSAMVQPPLVVCWRSTGRTRRVCSEPIWSLPVLFQAGPATLFGKIRAGGGWICDEREGKKKGGRRESKSEGDAYLLDGNFKGRRWVRSPAGEREGSPAKAGSRSNVKRGRKSKTLTLLIKCLVRSLPIHTKYHYPPDIWLYHETWILHCRIAYSYLPGSFRPCCWQRRVEPNETVIAECKTGNCFLKFKTVKRRRQSFLKEHFQSNFRFSAAVNYWWSPHNIPFGRQAGKTTFTSFSAILYISDIYLKCAYK